MAGNMFGIQHCAGSLLLTVGWLKHVKTQSGISLSIHQFLAGWDTPSFISLSETEIETTTISNGSFPRGPWIFVGDGCGTTKLLKLLQLFKGWHVAVRPEKRKRAAPAGRTVLIPPTSQVKSSRTDIFSRVQMEPSLLYNGCGPQSHQF